MTDAILYTAGMTDQQRLLFLSEFNAQRKNPTTAVLLTLFLGGLGGHRFYLGDTFWGVIYLLTCWSFIPLLVSFVELFLVSGRVRRYNERLAIETAAKVRIVTASPAAATT